MNDILLEIPLSLPQAQQCALVWALEPCSQLACPSTCFRWPRLPAAPTAPDSYDNHVLAWIILPFYDINQMGYIGLMVFLLYNELPCFFKNNAHGEMTNSNSSSPIIVLLIMCSWLYWAP